MRISTPEKYRTSVFINCPFDSQYQTLFHAIVFAVCDCGYIARCALEISDASQIRLNKIFQIISECRIGIHDISRTELDAESKLPRFNMPLELGMFLGAKSYGTRRQQDKLCLIFERDQFRYQKFCSDIAGQDISAHGGKAIRAVVAVRDFLRNAHREVTMLGGKTIFERYNLFRRKLPSLCEKAELDFEGLIFNDYTTLVSEWLKLNPQG